MKKNILYIIHSWIDFRNVQRTSIGGTTLHAYDLLNNTLDKNNYFILSVSDNKYILTIYANNKVNVYNLGITCKGYFFDYYDAEYNIMLKKIIGMLSIDIVHIHHLRGHALDIYNVIKETEVFSILTIHDYFIICPQINLLYKSDNYCTKKTRSIDCKNCIKVNNPHDLKLKERNFVVNGLFEEIDKIIIPNISIKDEIMKTYDSFSAVTIEHGITIQKTDNEIKINKDKFNVAFVGVLEILKGSQLAKELVNVTNSDENIVYHFFGTTSIEELKINKHNYFYHGEYMRQDLPMLLKEYEINLVCLLTKCPETYCYTLSEVIYSGVPVLGIDLGAIGERIKRLGCGWTINHKATANNLLNKINQIKNNESQYYEVLGKIKKIVLDDVYEMVRKTVDIYDLSNNSTKKIIFKYGKLIRKNFKYSVEVKEETKIKKIIKRLNKYKNKVIYLIKRPIYLFYIFTKKIIKKIIKMEG